ncbi:hypothetical protein AVEN_154020-1 [Araneus ventricosus]|uniref:Tc1-like transposase DDE domain-containing protein n=1 Tax=Araneus ventricosus TaxID=182803 RepID=A0A4Y2IJZ9_ARAVE|nr:hypothetical protein AVEN_154020-1 [Araneus ventricosus]
MVGRIEYGGKTSLVFLSDRQKDTYNLYIEELESELLHYGSELGGEDWMFHQDGASIRTTNAVKNWFIQSNMRVLPWADKRPDLNIVENIWAIPVHREHAGGKQCESAIELREVPNNVWTNFCQAEIQNLYDSLPDRILEVKKLVE